jgi:hypothetical protein
MGDQEFDAPVVPEYKQFEEPKKGHGCFFYGCITAIVLSLLLVIGIGVITYVTYRYVAKKVEEYTDTKPVTLPVVELPKGEMDALHERLDRFKEAVKTGKTSETIVLTADEINALFQENPELRGTVFVSIDGDKVTGKISLPLSKIKMGLFQGRYLNGSATLRVSLKDRELDVRADEITVKGQPIPASFMDQLRNKNLAEDSLNDRDTREAVSKLDSIEIKDGKIIAKSHARPPEPATDDEKKAEKATDKDAPAQTPEAETKKSEDAKPAVPDGDGKKAEKPAEKEPKPPTPPERPKPGPETTTDAPKR